ncbi:hypothetical protein SK128_025430 [Halocaridina rubra]|uniref:Uncharacterized protein n=1 Tax=Halocaridina rubra TaxID=373956 RepID=A0AAN9A4F2_HALRR
MIMADRAMSSFSSALAKALDEKKSPRGVSVFTFAMNSDGRNESKAALSQIISEARKVRKISWCLSVIVVSEDVSFLKNFAIGALQGRFLVWKTRLLIVTRLKLHQLSSLLKGYWTFSMMNTLFLNMEASLPFPSFHKAVVNVSSKPWPPYWTEEKVTKPDGTKDIRISGTDGLLLHAVSQSLNFTFYNVPTANWDEVSFISSYSSLID